VWGEVPSQLFAAQMLIQAGHDLNKVAGFVPVVELMD
jgi:hypothetical protein